jgi:NAD+ synthase (glutamine-hydrolysing)
VTLKKFQTDINYLSFPNTEFLPVPTNTQEADWTEAICLGIRDFVYKNNLKQVYLGLSGGIDSAVTTVLASQALGTENITALSLPSRFNDPRSTITSQELCNKLNIGFHEISIEPFFNLFEQELKTLTKKDTVSENIQARLRAVILMAYVNFYGGVLLNTSNKTELSLGYGTLYGDLAGTLSPIGDLTKPEVYQLARWINRSQEIIPEFILNRKPSAELRLNQIDPFDYPIISPQIENFVQNNQSAPTMRASEHKRHQFGTILKLSQKTFGYGRFIPITRR